MNSGQYKISEAVKLLQRDYSDISSSALRYWDKLDLVKPSSRSDGGHRLYTDYDLELIRVVKEMSLAKYPNEEIRKVIQGRKLQQGPGGRGAISDLKDLRKAMEELDQLLKQRTFEDAAFYESVYTEDALLKLVGEDKRALLEKAKNYRLIRPTTNGNTTMYSKVDEKILRILSFGGEDFIDECKESGKGAEAASENLHVPAFQLGMGVAEYYREQLKEIDKPGGEKNIKMLIYAGIIFLLIYGAYQLIKARR